MTVQTVADKAVRLIRDGKVRLVDVRTTDFGALAVVQARVESATDPDRAYWVQYNMAGFGWVCSCPASLHCAHLTAVALVTGLGD